MLRLRIKFDVFPSQPHAHPTTDHLKKVPASLPVIKVDPEKPNPKLGVGLIKFNCDGRLVATRNGNLAQS